MKTYLLNKNVVNDENWYDFIRSSITLKKIIAGKENVYSAEEVKKVLIDERNNFSKCQEISSTDVFLFK
ncbi:hypothetical protein C2820_05820 [Pasteurella multocida]|uniref:hypothetical protein n=1 Tax=Pasteurella multocida TaxID=747 RepID=UPI00147AB3A0|nr:hypothetical protein [Pasteurella multocida]NNI37608.1 hypothetical protein [Pasteurella multocida]